MNDILGDRTSGASALYKKTLNLLQTETKYNAPDEALRIIDKIKSQFPEMAVFEYLSLMTRRSNKNEYLAVLRFLELECSTELKLINNQLNKIWLRRKRIVTFSNSSVVEHIICENQIKVESVLLSQASPKNEGVILGEKLHNAGLKVEICSDAALPNLIKKSDYIFLGADCVAKRYFINKAGTYPLLLAAKAKCARSFIFCEKFKIIPSFKFAPGSQDSSEIARPLSGNMRVNNYYFERIPINLADYLISGYGIKIIKTGRQ
ncbi:MAG: hypothetical protein ABIE07_12895 [Candidatus Zixiibacteriota bacterium]